MPKREVRVLKAEVYLGLLGSEVRVIRALPRGGTVTRFGIVTELAPNMKSLELLEESGQTVTIPLDEIAQVATESPAAPGATHSTTIGEVVEGGEVVEVRISCSCLWSITREPRSKTALEAVALAHRKAARLRPRGRPAEVGARGEPGR